MLASAVSDTLPTVINQSGVIRANSVAENNGVVTLSGGATGIVKVSGTIEAKDVDRLVLTDSPEEAVNLILRSATTKFGLPWEPKPSWILREPSRARATTVETEVSR